VIPCPVADTEKPPKVSYEMTRFNTLKHEILLRLLQEVRAHLGDAGEAEGIARKPLGVAKAAA